MRAALVVPLVAAIHGPGGVIVVLSTRRGTFHNAHLQALGAYAAFVWMAIATRLQAAEAQQHETTASSSAIG